MYVLHWIHNKTGFDVTVTALLQEGDEISEKELDDLFKLVDENKDGKIQYEGNTCVLLLTLIYVLWLSTLK